jgi:hypothetical protein
MLGTSGVNAAREYLTSVLRVATAPTVSGQSCTQRRSSG